MISHASRDLDMIVYVRSNYTKTLTLNNVLKVLDVFLSYLKNVKNITK